MDSGLWIIYDDWITYLYLWKMVMFHRYVHQVMPRSNNFGFDDINSSFHKAIAMENQWCSWEKDLQMMDFPCLCEFTGGY